MKRFVAGLALAFTLGLAGATEAGVYSDDLSKCLVRSATPSDQTAFMVWLFAAMSVHPDVKAYSAMTDTQREAVSRRAAELLVRLMAVDCHNESVAALKYEGESALSAGFNVFGQVAARGLLGNAVVAQDLARMEGYVDKSKLEALATEAGIAAAKK
jgi:hypothetical protein